MNYDATLFRTGLLFAENKNVSFHAISISVFKLASHPHKPAPLKKKKRKKGSTIIFFFFFFFRIHPESLKLIRRTLRSTGKIRTINLKKFFLLLLII